MVGRLATALLVHPLLLLSVRMLTNPSLDGQVGVGEGVGPPFSNSECSRC